MNTSQSIVKLQIGSTLLSPSLPNGDRIKLSIHSYFKDAGVVVLRMQLSFAKHQPTYIATLKELQDEDYQFVEEE
jgi:hypothetical protein